MIDQLKAMFPAVTFIPGEKFSWSPNEHKITYSQDDGQCKAHWALLHETGHALLDHASYSNDYELIEMEVAAWEKAKEIASKIGAVIDESHIQDCLDSYRDWLYKRSICPSCGTKTIQSDQCNSYSCFNCHSKWQVSPSRFCRSYRALKKQSLVELI